VKDNPFHLNYSQPAATDLFNEWCDPVSLVINSNPTSMKAQGHLSRTERSLSSSFRKISSGSRVTRAADDSAALAVAENLDSDSRSTRQAKRNINDGISMIQTYEGATNEISDILKRGRELAVQASSETLANEERQYVQAENQELQKEVFRISQTLNFNGINLGTGGSSVSPEGVRSTDIDVQAGMNNTGNDRITISLNGLHPMEIDAAYQMHVMNETGAPAADPSNSHLPDDLMAGLTLDTAENAQKALYAFDFSLNYINEARSSIGAVQNRLESALNNADTFDENLNSAESHIRDADFAQETATMSKTQIMQQAGVAVLGQANSLPQSALRLI
jgi:flagellin